MAFILWYTVLIWVQSSSCFLQGYLENEREPLFLTAYIKTGRVNEGRRLAQVPFTKNFFNITSYSGFFTVDEYYNSNLFFWYFPPIVPTHFAPVVVWLQGGPGYSSLYGLFTQTGPLKVTNGIFQKRKTTWALHNHMIYIDNPVGAGFSFTNEGYCKNQSMVGQHLYSFTRQFFRIFPELQSHGFYITGESYAGKYIPAFAYTIHVNNPIATVKINLKGMAIGNGLTDPINQLVYSEYLYQIGLFDREQATAFWIYEKEIAAKILKEDWKEATGMLMGVSMRFKALSGFKNIYNLLYSKEDAADLDFIHQIQSSFIRRQIHVGSLEYNVGYDVVMDNLIEDIGKSVADWLAELLDYYPVTIYAGQLDITVPYPSIVNYLRKLKFRGSEGYAMSERRVWRVDGDIAGYVRVVGNLREVFVRNAGHFVPKDQPKWALDLITKVTKDWYLNGRQ